MPHPHADLSCTPWRKSSRSSQLGECVEVAAVPGYIGVRDSKNPGGTKLVFTGPEWATFLHHAQQGAYDPH